MNRLERLYAVAEELRRHAPGTVSAARLAERFDVTRRTIERDLVALRDAGVPLYASPGRNGGYGVVERDGRTVFTLSAKEVVALLIAVAAADRAPYADAAESAAQRLVDALPEPTRVAVDELVGCIRTSDSERARPAARVRRALEEAVRTGRVVNLDYVDGQGEATTRAVEAIGFYRSTDGWYLIGWCRLRQDRRIFRLDRIKRASMTKQRVDARNVDDVLGWVPHPVRSP